jgi:Fe-S oxidoreductase/nitrate reductase gamma subunit
MYYFLLSPLSAILGPMENLEATRQILWNVDHPALPWVMYGSMFLALAVAAIGILSRVELWQSGKGSLFSGLTLPQIIQNFTTWGALQKGVVKKRTAGFIHTLIYFGFLVLLFTTTIVAIHHDLGLKIYQGNFYLILTVASDIFGLGLIIGCALAFHRRFIASDGILHNRTADWLILFLLVLLCVQGFILEGARIAATHDQWRNFSIVGLLFSKLFWGMSESTIRTIHWLTWWWHTFTVFGCFALMPYSKFFHIVSSLLNVSLRNSKRAKGALPFPGDMEKMIEAASDDFSVGLGTIKDYSAKQLLDLDACTSCGRCQEVCPAYNTGKPLSPKWIILDTRNHMLDLHASGEFVKQSKLPSVAVSLDRFMIKDYFLPSIGHKSADKSFRASNKLVQNAVLGGQGTSIDARISGEVIDPSAFWSCTTCMACVNSCPVSINHVDQIIENRRNMVLMNGELPHEAQSTLKALETRANPYGDPNARSDWFADLDLKVLKPGDEVDYLYWVGCVSAYDQRKQKIAKSLVKIMKAAGLSFGVLGNAEGCTGDPARRLGEENLFQTLAKSNLEILRSVKFKTVVANCPHCFNTLKNEYPQLGNLQDGATPEIIHHSKLLKQLLDENKISPKNSEMQTFTFHDPCYLGRYNDEYDAPRDSLKSIKSLRIVEMEDSREKGMCCGAGGGHFWMDLKVGDRVNQVRATQAASTGADKIATACPFCMQMMEDGVKLNNQENSLVVKDIAEVIADNL